MVPGTCAYENRRPFHNFNFWTFTPEVNGSYSFRTCGSNFDNVVTVQTGCHPDTSLYCDDDSCICDDDGNCDFDAPLPWNARIPFIPLQGGVTYYVTISSTYPGETGSGVMTIELQPTAAPTVRADSLQGVPTP